MTAMTTIITITIMRMSRERFAMRLLLASAVIAGLAVLAQPASAQVVEECDWRAGAPAIAEPWDENTRTFANGNVRLALLDTIEPAAGAMHILVLSPPRGELGERRCQIVSLSSQIGFSGIEFGRLDAGYDPARGLTFKVPVGVYDGSASVPRILVFTLNQATGEIVVDLD